MADVSKLLGAAGGVSSMVPGIGTAVGAGLSIAGQAFGAIKGAKEAKKNQDLINKKQAENEADYNLNGQRSFLETNAAKDAVKAQNDALQDAQKNVAGRSAITGASDEAVVASNTGVQKNYSDAISRLAGAGTQYQQNEKRMYLARKDSLDSQQMQLNQQKSDAAANLVGNAGDLMNGLAFNEGMKSKTQSPGQTLFSKLPTIGAKNVQVGGERQFVQPQGLEVNKLLKR